MAKTVERDELRDFNRRARNGDQSFLPSTKLDTSLKKNTTLVRKLKTISRDTRQSLVKDITTTSLEKYLGEAASSVFEAVLKLKKNEDWAAVVEVVSLLHQRFPEKFTPIVMAECFNGFQDPRNAASKEDRAEVVQKVKAAAKLLTELTVVDVVDNDIYDNYDHSLLPDFVLKREDKQPFLLTLVQEVFVYGLRTSSLLPFISSYLKTYDWLFKSKFVLGDIQEEWGKAADRFIGLYTEKIFKQTGDVIINWQKQKAKNEQISMKTGKVVEELANEVEDLERDVKRLTSIAEALGAISGKDVPDFSSAKYASTDVESASSITIVKQGKDDPAQYKIWESDEEKAFYRSIPSFSSLVQEGSNPEESSLTVKQFIQLLESAGSAQEVEALVKRFWLEGLNTPKSSSALLKHFTTDSNSTHFKNFARFLAITKEPLKVVLEGLIEDLDSKFRSQIHSRQAKLQFSSLYFFCELIKFKLIPIYVVYHKMRSLVLNLKVHTNIEILGVFLECCGPIFMNDPDYKEPFAEIIQLLKEKRSSVHLDIDSLHRVDMVLLSIEPQPVRKQELKELSPVEEFLKHILKNELNDKSWEEIVKIIKSVDYKRESNCYKFLQFIFTHPEEVNYQNLTALSKVIILYSSTSDPAMKTYVIDTLIESTQRGLELNDFRENRQRLVLVTLLTKLCHPKMLRATELLNVMYRILCFGYPGNNPMPDVVNTNDPPENYFRVSMICQILSNLNKAAISSREQKKFDTFLIYFDYFCLLKQQPIPADVNFKLVTMYSTFRPDFKRSKNWQQAAQKLQAALALQNSSANSSVEEENEEEDDLGVDSDLGLGTDGAADSDSDDEMEDDDEDSESGSDDLEASASEEEEEDDDDDADSEDDEEEEDEFAARERKLQEELRDAEERKWQENMDKEFKMMMAESYQQRKNENIAKFQVPLPIGGQKTTTDSGKVSFTLLSRDSAASRKPKFLTRQVELPAESKLASKFLREEQRKKEETEAIKNSVLNRNFD